MSTIREQAVQRMRQDHDGMIALIRRIQSICGRSDDRVDCKQCQPNLRQVCHGDIELLLRSFIEATLKHNFLESLYMEDGVPKAHRLAHNEAHMGIAEQLKGIRLVMSQDGNCVLAIAGIDKVLGTLLAHFVDYDQQLEAYLMAPA